MLKSSLRRKFSGLAPISVVLPLLAIASSTLTNVAIPLTIKNIADCAFKATADSQAAIIQATLLSFAILFLRFFTDIHKTRVQILYERSLQKAVGRSGLTSIMRQPFRSKGTIQTDEFFSVLGDELTRFAELGSELLSVIPGQAFGLVVSAVMLLVISPKQCILILVCGICVALASRWFSKQLLEFAKSDIQEKSRYKASLATLISALLTVRLFGQETLAHQCFESSHNSFLTVRAATKTQADYFRIGSAFFTYFIQIAIISLACLDVIYGKLSVGDLLALIAVFGAMMTNLMTLGQLYPQTKELEILCDRLKGLMEEDHSDNKLPKIDAKVLAFSKLSYSFKDKKIFDSFDLSIDKAGFYHLLGRNGSGKTTLFELILGMRRGTGALACPSIERVSAYLLTHRFLPVRFIDLVYNYRSSPSMERFDEICVRLGINNEMLSKEAKTLSAGELQRCAILLTILKDADLYIFDEPVANIAANEQLSILTHIRDLLREKIVIFTSHVALDLIPEAQRIELANS